MDEPDKEDVKRIAEADLFGGETIALPSAAPPVTPSSMPRSFGDYELLDEIARGGMGVVFKARQKRLNRIVALKMILAGDLADEENVQRFYTEAEAAAALRHPNIVSIYEVGEANGQHFFSMEYVEGCSLEDVIGETGLEPMQAASILCSVADAIHYAHEQGVIHRDLKPQNVLMDGNDEPQVTDFGLAKLTESGADLTQDGTVMGTPAFMSPEQASGKQEDVGPLSDVYSLGALLFMALTGRPPFNHDNHLEVLLQVKESEPPRLREVNPEIPRDLDTICLKCLAKDPAQRYATAGDLAEDLENFLEGDPIKAQHLGFTGRVLRWARQKPLLATTYFAAAAFYAVHLFNLHVLKMTSEGGTLHWVLSGLLLVLIGAATVVQWMLDRDRWRKIGVYTFFTIMPLLFMIPLSLDRGISGTPVNLYLVTLILCMLFAQGPRLVWYVAGVNGACYAGLILHAMKWRPENLISIKDRIVFYVLLITTGVLVHLLMRRTRPVSDAGTSHRYTLPGRSTRRGRSGGSSRVG